MFIPNLINRIYIVFKKVLGTFGGIIYSMQHLGGRQTLYWRKKFKRRKRRKQIETKVFNFLGQFFVNAIVFPLACRHR